jgi:hypothetical protein
MNKQSIKQNERRAQNFLEGCVAVNDGFSLETVSGTQMLLHHSFTFFIYSDKKSNSERERERHTEREAGDVRWRKGCRRGYFYRHGNPN